MLVKSNEEKEILLECGRRLALVLDKTKDRVRPGVKARELEDYARGLIDEMGDIPAFLNYTPGGATRPYPAALCISINDEVVHGIPNEEEKIIKEGDIVTLDAGLIHRGLFTDHAITIPVGKVDSKGMELIATTKLALDEAVKFIKPGIKTGEVGHLIENIAREYGFVPADGLGGHGIGRSVHEEPFMPNFGPKEAGPELKEGQVVAVEPIFNEGSSRVDIKDDGYTFVTNDGKRSAQFEHTLLIEKEGAVILTKL